MFNPYTQAVSLESPRLALLGTEGLSPYINVPISLALIGKLLQLFDRLFNVSGWCLYKGDLKVGNAPAYILKRFGQLLTFHQEYPTCRYNELETEADVC